MAFILLIYFILSTNSRDFSVDESYCVYDRSYSDTFTSNNAICLIRCTFISIKSDSKGGAIAIKNEFGTQNLIDNCKFINCSSKIGGAISFEQYKQKRTTIITNSIFTGNSAKSDCGAIYFFSIPTNNLQVKNCSFNSNYAFGTSGVTSFQHLHFSFEDCKFNDNKSNPNNSSRARGGSIYFISSSGIFIKCIFSNNIANATTFKSQGGAICLTNGYYDQFESFQECTFINNTSISKDGYSDGGAISYLKLEYNSLNVTMKNCSFKNNSVESNSHSSYGGAISSDIKINISFINISFDSNLAKSISKNSYGGAFYYSCEQESYFFNNGPKILSESIFINTTFNNNKAISNSITYGGSISFIQTCPYFPETLQRPNAYFTNVNFIDNIASSSLLTLGGAIRLNRTNGFFHNCSFINNVAESFLNKIEYNESFKIFGGGIYLLKSEFNFHECLFMNNCGNGNWCEGGALYSLNCKINISNSDFINNSLFKIGQVVNENCSVEGGAYFSKKTANCNFINNTALENSIHFPVRIIGGAICSDKIDCTNCTFKENSVYVPNHKEKEFAGSIYLTNGSINYCIFENNFAYNGADINYDQIENSNLNINECIFKNNDNQINSLIYINVISNSQFSINNFTSNSIFLNTKKTYLFDGEFGLQKNIYLIFNFNYNCFSPYDKQYYKTDRILFHEERENIYYEWEFEKAFSNSSCMKDLITQSKPIMTQTQVVPSKNVIQTNSVHNNEVNKLKSIFNLLIIIMVFQIIAILLFIVLIFSISKKIVNNTDLDPLVGDIN